jgi:hypothetical protein
MSQTQRQSLANVVAKLRKAAYVNLQRYERIES